MFGPGDPRTEEILDLATLAIRDQLVDGQRPRWRDLVSQLLGSIRSEGGMAERRQSLRLQSLDAGVPEHGRRGRIERLRRIEQAVERDVQDRWGIAFDQKSGRASRPLRAEARAAHPNGQRPAVRVSKIGVVTGRAGDVLRPRKDRIPEEQSAEGDLAGR